MREFRRAFKNDRSIDGSAYYVFLVKGSGSQRAGFMPFKREFGFVFTDRATNLTTTIAHELGHGAFRLRHTFSSEDFKATERTTTNLMDYNGGTVLKKYQWDFVHDPESMNGWLQGDEEGAMGGTPQPVIVYVNGYWNKDWPKLAGGDNLRDYWETNFITRARTLLNTQNEYFINGASTSFSSGSARFEEGKKFVNDRFSNKQSDFYKKVIQSVQNDNGNFIKPLYFVSHSMGSAFAEGMISALQEKGVMIDKVYHFSPADVSGFSATLPDKTYEIDIFPDIVLAYKNLNDAYYIKDIRFFGIVNNPEGVTDIYGHYYTKAEGFVWNWAQDLSSGSIIPDGEIVYLYPSGDPAGEPISKPAYRFNSPQGTNFIHLLFNGVLYTRDGNKYIKK
jgi:hypothetical protein